MFGKKFLAAAVALTLPFGASAATISISTFNATDYNAAVGAGSYTSTNFEDEGLAGGERMVGAVLQTDVGNFSSAGGQGSGGTVKGSSFNNDGTQLALREGNVFGRTDQVGGRFFLDSNDTTGIHWAVSRVGGALFDTVLFVMTDHAEYSTLTVTAGGSTRSVSGIGGSVSQTVAIDFGQLVSGAVITLEQGRNDGFSIDGAQVGVAAVPLPAAGVLLIAGLGGLAAMRRFKGENA